VLCQLGLMTESHIEQASSAHIQMAPMWVFP